MWKYYAKRDLNWAYKEFRKSPINSINGEIEELQKRMFVAYTNREYQLKNDLKS